MTENQGILQAAFAETDTISYGPFMVTKAPGARWKQAHAFINGQEVFLTPLKKRYLALLIRQQGEPVTIEHFAAEIPTSNPSRWYAKSRQLDDHVEKRGARKELINTIKVTVSLLKRDLRDQAVSDDICQNIEPVGLYRQKGDKGPFPEGMSGAYRINLPPSP